ncbi:MAG TPA: HU family DNA-binding protein [Pyrinomonadaceae bacterium]|nr:HU family DNA-binding protein [Pyrinomonadaceae bacterium]
MIKLDIVNRVAERTGVPKMKAEQAVDALFHSMKEALARGERIELRGFGVFVVKPRKRGVGRNPRTGEEVAIPSGKTIRFKPGKELQAHGFSGEHDDEHHDDEHQEDLHTGGPTPDDTAAAPDNDAGNTEPRTDY